MDVLWWREVERCGNKKTSDLRLTTPLKNEATRGRNGVATPLTMHTALAMVLGTRWGTGGSMVCRFGGERDRFSPEVGADDAKINACSDYLV